MTTKQEPLAPELLATAELYKFAEEFDLSIELDKLTDDPVSPLIYRVADSEDVTIKQIVIEVSDIEYFENHLEEYAGTLLNKVSQVYPK